MSVVSVCNKFVNYNLKIRIVPMFGILGIQNNIIIYIIYIIYQHSIYLVFIFRFHLRAEFQSPESSVSLPTAIK